jgi:Family of unknown function (DUF6325)
MPISIDPDTIGPVDVAVIGFTGDGFNGEIAPALRDLADSGVVRIIDLAFVRKDADGNSMAVELEDANVADAFAGLDDEQQDLLSDADLDLIAESLEPATAALVIVWENSWAARFSGAVRRSNGFLVSQDRIPHEAVVRAIEAL